MPVRAVVAVLMLGMVACGSPSGRPEATPPGPIATAAGPGTTTAPQGTTLRPVTTVPATRLGAPLPPQLAGVGPADQAVVVTAAAYGHTSATLTAWARTAGGWQQVFGPWSARVGTKGLALPGEKREGDGRTPSGVYGFDFFFGVDSDPGVRFPYRRITSRDIVWDDDSASPRYNQWVDLRESDGGVEPEAMYQPTAYQHGAVIAYNSARTPGLGSAIFLHASTGGPTAGCVSLPVDQLVQVLRWLDPARSPRIVLAVEG